MGHIAVWKTLDEMIADFRKKGLNIPPDVMNDLTSARTMTKILGAEESHVGTLQRLEIYLANVESYLINEGEKKFGSEYAGRWLDRLDRARRQAADEENTEGKFVLGVPRQQKWMRVAPSPELPFKKLEQMAQKLKLSLRTQKDGSLLVYGENQKIKEFVKKLTSNYKLKAEKYREKVHNC